MEAKLLNRVIPANQGEISRKNMAAQGEFFCSYH